jgi:pteridine reductase
MSLKQTFDCEHPVALVTGSGAPRVGRAVAMRLAFAGCRLVIHARRSFVEANEVANQLRHQGTEVLVVQAEMEDERAVEAMIASTVSTFGRLDILVNAAAIWEPTKLEDVTAASLRRYFDVNAVGSFVAARAAGLQMVKQPTGGAIINFGDWATCRPYLDHADYFPSKGAVEAMTRSLAVELAQRNPRVRVNCIQPGPVLLSESVDEETRAAIANSVLLKRIGTAEEVAHAVEFLCENQFVTGITLPVDGGKSIFANDGLQSGLNTG